MRKMHNLILASGCAMMISLASPFADAQTLNERVSNAAKCAGVIIGNALGDFEVDRDSRRFQSRIEAPIYYYYEAVIEEGVIDSAHLYDALYTASLDDTYKGIFNGEFRYLAKLTACYDNVLQRIRKGNFNKDIEDNSRLSAENLAAVLHEIIKD